MFRSAAVLAGAWLSVLTPAALGAQDLPSAPPVRAIHITGAREIAPQTIQEALRVRVGERLVDTPERIGESVQRQYRDEGYKFARVKASFEASTGDLSLDIDEGTIDEIVFQGIDEKLAQATQPLQSSPPEVQDNKPAEAKPGGDRPTTPAPEPARPDAQAQKAGAQPVLPPAPAEKIAPPIKDK